MKKILFPTKNPFSRICNPAGVSIRTYSPEKSASQMLILIGAGLQIQPNGLDIHFKYLFLIFQQELIF